MYLTNCLTSKLVSNAKFRALVSQSKPATRYSRDEEVRGTNYLTIEERLRQLEIDGIDVDTTMIHGYVHRAIRTEASKNTTTRAEAQ